MEKFFDNTLERLFPPAMRAAGYIPMAFALLLFYSLSWITGLLFMLVGAFITFATNGIRIDTKTWRYKQFIGFLGIKLGKWKTLESYQQISLLKNHETTTAFSRSNRNTTTSDEVFYDTVLLDTSHHNKLVIMRSKDEQEAKESTTKLAQSLNLEFVKYAPQMSQQTLSRKRKERIKH